MGDYQQENAVIERRPADNAVLAERPLLVQAAFQMYKITALPQPHLARESGKLIEIGRIIGNAPYTRLGQIVIFHSDHPPKKLNISPNKADTGF
jgi:hypothetical protein